MAQIASSFVLVAVCTAIGVRLLLLWRRTRALPELLIGASFLLAGSVASGFGIFSLFFVKQPALRAVLIAASALALNFGICCLTAFVWRVFRPGSAAGRAGFAALIAAIVTTGIGEWLARQSGASVTTNPWLTAAIAVRIAVYVWATAECFAYWTQLRRRVQIGLAEREVANRMLLWGVGTLAICVLWGRDFAAGLGLVPPSAPGSLLATGLVIACATSHWVAFFPPARLRGKAAAA